MEKIFIATKKKVGCKLHYKVILVGVVPQRLIEKHWIHSAFEYKCPRASSALN